MAFAAVSGVWLLAQPASLDSRRRQRLLAWLSRAAAVMAAGYTAFLFAQAEGRDLWQSRWLFPHLLAQAADGGAGAIASRWPSAGADDDAVALTARVLVARLAGAPR